MCLRKIFSLALLLTASAIAHATHEAQLTFEPGCDRADPVCGAWTAFRRAHPYPYQAVAARVLGAGEIALIVSEPSPALTPGDWERLAAETFGDDLLRSVRWRWMIGVDGWVQDLVLHVRSSGARSDAQLLADAAWRDRIALLHLAQYGTTYGARVERIGEVADGDDVVTTPNLEPAAHELHAWLTDTSLRWYRIAQPDSAPQAWREPGRTSRAALVSEDATLVMLTFPARDLVAIRGGLNHEHPLRGEFRHFAVSADAIVGGAWTADGQVALLARARFAPLRASPPLRYETFALLAAHRENEFYQSYERTHVLAGKLRAGRYELMDWAPILLSAELIDTEFGALLNITDQMLKSWSEAGAVDYLYFDYPDKPGTFPFGERKLSEIVRERLGSDRVLFNWNTAGSAAVVEFPELSVLVPRQTGALPVTYGSELQAGGEMQTGHLRDYEGSAYDYFSSLADPNLARVVQYTLVYQLGQALAGDPRLRDVLPEPTPPDLVVAQRADATRLLIARTAALLDGLLDSDDEQLHEARQALAALLAEHGLERARLAKLIADPRGAYAALDAEADTLAGQLETLASDERALQGRIDAYNDRLAAYEQAVAAFNAEVDALNGRGNIAVATFSDMERRRAQIERLSERLVRESAAIERSKAEQASRLSAWTGFVRRRGQLAAASAFRHTLQGVAATLIDIDGVREDYLAANAAEPAGWIKTPSAVLSWANGIDGMFSVGGHNIDARALRLEASSAVTDIEVVQTPTGTVVRYNPERAGEVASNATRIARAVEHGGVTNSQSLRGLLVDSAPPRPRHVALRLPDEAVGAARSARARIEHWGGELGTRVHRPRTVAQRELAQMAAERDCCLFVKREPEAALLAERNASPPPAALMYRFNDNVSLVTHLSRAARPPNGKPVVLFDVPVGHAQALARGVGAAADTPGGLRRVAALIRDTARRAQDDLTIVHHGIDGRAFTLNASVRPGATGTGAQRLVDAYAARPDWGGASVRSLGRREVQRLLPKDWRTATDGTPSAVVISFRQGGAAQDVTVFGAVDAAQARRGARAMLEVNREVVGEAARTPGASLGQVLGTIKARLRALGWLKLERLRMMVRDRDNRIIFTGLTPAPASALG